VTLGHLRQSLAQNFSRSSRGAAAILYLLGLPAR